MSDEGREIWRFHHIGLACRDIDTERPGVEAIGYTPETGKIHDQIQNVIAQFMTGPGPRLELIQPAAPGSPLDGFLKRGVKMYHMAYEAFPFEGKIAELETKGFRSLGPPVAAVAFEMRRIVFMISETMNLIELIDAGPPPTSEGS